MMTEQIIQVWVFNGTGSKFPAAIFTKKELAESWIMQNCLSGILTLYPLDIGIYDWAINNGHFTTTKPHEKEAEFIQKFTSASQEHFHYEGGVLA